jgi:hypothetical protein
LYFTSPVIFAWSMLSKFFFMEFLLFLVFKAYLTSFDCNFTVGAC